MKKTRHAIAAAAFAFALAAGAPAALAGSGAGVLQTGNQNYSIVVQKKNKTSVESWTATNSIERFQSESKIMKTAKQAQAPERSRSGFFGSSCGSLLGGGNAAFAAQTGSGNAAYASQQGSNNLAGTAQDGRNNKSYILQKGNSHEATAQQYGNNNTSLIVQRC